MVVEMLNDYLTTEGDVIGIQIKKQKKNQ